MTRSHSIVGPPWLAIAVYCGALVVLSPVLVACVALGWVVDKMPQVNTQGGS